MSNFIYDATTLSNWPKSNYALNPSVPATQKVTGPDWNQIAQALMDVQAFCRGANWLGVTRQASDPAPAGVADYLWVRTSDGALMHNGSQVGGASAATGLWGAAMSAVPTIASTGLNAWWNQPTNATATDNAVGTSVFAPNQGGNNICMRRMAAPATPYTLTILVSNTSIYNAICALTFGWSSSATSGPTEFIYYLPTEQSNQLQVDRYNSAVSFNSAAYNVGAKSFFNNPLWLRISDDGTTARYATSQDGINFITFFSVTKSGSFLGASGYSNIVFGMHASGGDGYATIMSWKQT